MAARESGAGDVGQLHRVNARAIIAQSLVRMAQRDTDERSREFHLDGAGFVLAELVEQTRTLECDDDRTDFYGGPDFDAPHMNNMGKEG